MHYIAFHAHRGPYHAAPQRGHRVLRAGHAARLATLRRRAYSAAPKPGRPFDERRHDLSPPQPNAGRGPRRHRVARGPGRLPGPRLPNDEGRTESARRVPARVGSISRDGRRHLWRKRRKAMMSAPHADQLVSEYLSRLDSALAGVPRRRREEILDEISNHIAEERSRLHDESDADLRNLLDRVGDPAEGADAARDSANERPPAPLRRTRTPALLTPILTPAISPSRVQ